MINNPPPELVPIYYAEGKKTTKGPMVQRMKMIDPAFKKYLEKKYSPNKLGYPKMPAKGERQETINFINKYILKD